jgi:hypothetical protein
LVFDGFVFKVFEKISFNLTFNIIDVDIIHNLFNLGINGRVSSDGRNQKSLSNYFFHHIYIN